jgi:ubiquinone/menaquinone biosynthesis C-methylase UbiE
MDLRNDSIVADIGSGTGISAKPFLENGNFVFGVEPNQLMREASLEHLKDYQNFQCISGSAEDTGLKDKSVDLIIAAQAFHWFKNAKTLNEFRRILRKEGYIALIWNERQLDSTLFLREYENFLTIFGTDYETVRHDLMTKKTLDLFFGKDLKTATFENSQTLDFTGLLGRILSSSYMPTEKSPRFREMKKTLKDLFAEHAEQGKIQILYSTKIFYTKL